ncbi:YfcC family protein [Lactovum odontotermitis]
MENTKKKKFQLPSAFTILFIIIVIIAVLTWFIPAGVYKSDDAGNIIAGSYKVVKSNPQGIWDMLMAPIYGMLGYSGSGNIPATDGAIQISFFILMVGGFLGVVNRTGALEAGIGSIVNRFKGREKILIPVLMALFALGGSTYGMAEETLAFYGMIIPVMIAVGFDTVTAVAIVLVGSQVGCLASTVNPFATGVASQAVGISMGQGIGLRLFMLIVLTAISIFYVYRYASKIQKDPTKSLVYEHYKEDRQHFDIDSITSQEDITKRQKHVNIAFFFTFFLMIVSLVPWDMLNEHFTFFAKATEWLTGLPVIGMIAGKSIAPLGTWYFPEITMLFIVMAVIVALLYRMKESDFIGSFISGAGDLVSVALIVAVARGIQIVMNNGLITATILHWGEQGLSGLSSSFFLILTFIFYLPLSFLIPSTSGLAAATMGIMGPMGEFANVSKDLVITAYQSASGILNLITPTSAVVMGALAIARFNIGTWWKFMAKLIAIQLVVIIVILGIAAVL